MSDPISATAGAVTIIDRAAAVLQWLRGKRGERKPALPGRPRHSGFELVAVNFEVDLRQSQPSVELKFYAINYLPRDLLLTEVKVTQLNLGGPFVEHVPLVQEFTLPAKKSQLVYCRRHLMDSEVRALAGERPRDRWTASYALVARARRGGRVLTFGPVASMVIAGWVHPG